MRLSLVVRHYSFHWEHTFLGTIFIHEKTAPIHQRIVLELMPATTVRTHGCYSEYGWDIQPQMPPHTSLSKNASRQHQPRWAVSRDGTVSRDQ